MILAVGFPYSLCVASWADIIIQYKKRVIFVCLFYFFLEYVIVSTLFPR